MSRPQAPPTQASSIGLPARVRPGQPVRSSPAHLAPLALALLTAGAWTSGPLDGQRPAWAGVEVGCAPRAAWVIPERAIRIEGSADGLARMLVGPGDAVVVDRGADLGLRVGQRFYVRRITRPYTETRFGSDSPLALLTAGWIRIEEVGSRRAVGRVIHACDGIRPGDHLAPFDAPGVLTVAPATGVLDASRPATVLFGQEGGRTAAAGRFVVISRGAAQGVVRGQRFAAFRRGPGGEPRRHLGAGVAVAVSADTSTLLIVDSSDAVLAGDLVVAER